MSPNKNQNQNQTRKINFIQKGICLIRTVVLRIVLYLLSVIWFLPLVFLRLFFPWRYSVIFYCFWCFLSRSLCKYICGIKYEVFGLENLQGISVKDRKAVVFVSNHQSAWETIALPGLLTTMIYVLKKSLFFIPFLGWDLVLIKHIGINRSQKIESFKKVMKSGKTSLLKGVSVLIFPEGTRAAPFERLPFHKSAANLAKAAKVPIIPIVTDSGFCWPGKKFIACPGKVTVIIGPKIDTTNLTSTQAHEKSVNWILDNMKKLESKHIK